MLPGAGTDGSDQLRLQEENLEDDEELKLHIMGLNSSYCQVLETGFHTDVSRLPTRYLAPGTVYMLWTAYGEHCSLHGFIYYMPGL